MMVDLEKKKMKFEIYKAEQYIQLSKFQTWAYTGAMILSACILSVGLIYIRIGRNQAMNNIVELLKRFVLSFEDLVTCFR
mmetsp:Transcript_22230/g.30605  ORF Transcript_22230/g.30605 Transcript_22230/m.30605 type:complete len:80 (+) Transcript_22230:193-432(+)